jgi:hypothetical protein
VDKTMKKNNNAIRGRLSLGITNFSELIELKKIYIDKTRFIKKMMDDGEKYYFLSRPRRFGKTLFLSTLEHFFKGEKELFENTYIYENWDNWEEYPLIRISMKKASSENPEILKKSLLRLTELIAQDKNIDLMDDTPYTIKFDELIKKLSEKKNKVVVLIDEYDAPILSHLDDMRLANKNREILQEFYNVLKESDDYLKFVFITGLTKFTKVSVFSTFNNLTELSLDKDYSTICGITHQELKDCYHDHIQVLADENNYTYKEAWDKINDYYDGYSWDGTSNVFNPLSTLRALAQKEFAPFWFSTGTPSFIAEIFKKKEITEDYFKPTKLKITELDAIDPDKINETVLLFQAGYLTIEKKFIENDGIYYSLKIPNFEVETAFKDNLTELYLGEFKDKYVNIRKELWEDINNGKCNTLAYRLQSDISILSSLLNREGGDNWKNYTVVFLTWMTAMGFHVQNEKTIKHGRMDGVFEDFNNGHVVIVEIKYTEDQSIKIDNLIKKAIEQLHKKEYWLPYEGRKVSLIALAFKDEKIDNDTIITRTRCKIEDFDWNQVNNEDY